MLVRPISSQAIVRGKLVLAAMMTAAIWMLFVGYISLLFLRPGFTQSIQTAASSVPRWTAIGYSILAVSLLVLFSWKSMVVSLWICLTGRKWVEIANSFGFAGLLFVLVGVGFWISFHPELRAAALAAVPWLLGLLLAMKLAAAAFVVSGLLHWQLTTVRGAALMTATWLAVVSLLCALVFALLPPEQASATQVIPGVALSIPFTRLVGAPLALHWNRHR